MDNKILFLSPFFYPEPISTGKYNSQLVSSLVTEGFSVDVLCHHPFYPDWSVKSSNDSLEGVNIFRFGKYIRFPENKWLRRVILEVWYSISVFRFLKRSNDYQKAIVVFPPSLFVLSLSFFLKKDIIGIVHDLQGVHVGRSNNIFKNIMKFMIKYIEKRSFSKCSKLIFLSKEMKETTDREYSLDIESKVIYPFITISEYSNKGNLDDVISSSDINIVYSGALGDKQEPYKLASFMDSLKKQRSDVKVFIFSSGSHFEKIKSNFPEINCYPLVDESDLPELLFKSTVQIIPQKSGTSAGSLPSKLPNILASETKVLCVTDEGSELSSILNSHSDCRVSYFWDNDILIKKVSDLIGSNSLQVKKDNQVVLDLFSIKNLLNNF